MAEIRAAVGPRGGGRQMEAARNGVEVGNRVEESEGATSCRAPAGTRGGAGEEGWPWQRENTTPRPGRRTVAAQRWH